MKRTFATLGVVGLGLISLTAPAMAASDQVVACHWDGSTLVQKEFNVNGTGGHDQHPEDIIPPTSKVPAGKNWTNAGKIRYVNECHATLPPGEVIDPVDPPVVVDPPVTPVETPPAEPPVTVDNPVTELPVVQDPVVENPVVVQQPAETPVAVVPAAAPAQQPTAQQPAAAPKAAPKAAPAAAPVSVGTNQGYNAQTSVGASDAGPGWLAGVGALAAAAAAVAVRRRSRPQHVAG